MNVNRTIDQLFTTFILTSTLLVYYLIIKRLDVGTSGDEGFYLQGYLLNQTANYGISDFHNIVKSFSSILPIDFALTLRYVRFFATLVALAFFCLTSYRFFVKRYNVRFEKATYFALIFLSGAIGFCFTSPVLYYDSIQAIIYLLVFSLLFDTLSTESNRLLSSFFIGFLFIFAFTNYLPSGIFLAFSIFTLTLFYRKSVLKNFLFILFGFLFGVLFYHYFINDLLEWNKNVLGTLTTQQVYQSAGYGHSNSGLLLNFFEYLLNFIKYLIAPAALSVVFLFIKNKIKNKGTTHYIVSFIFILLLLLYCVFVVKKAYSTILLIPIVYLSIHLLFTTKIIFNKTLIKQLFVGLVFTFLPALAVFGTNQRIEAKAEFFVFLWVVFFFILLIKNDLIKKNFQIKIVTLLFTCCLLVSYVFLGHFNRFQYYYTPKQSIVTLDNTVNFNNIKVSENQKLFIEKTINLMRQNGFEEGDKIMAFAENQIIPYAAGGIIPNFVYEFNNMLNSPDHIPDKETPFIIINQGEVEEFTSYINKYRSWNFPQGYKRYEIGRYAENMPLPDFNTILYCLEK